MKCTKCGEELTGKFCTNCGAPAPTNPICPNCGEEITGKFCMKCGTPAPSTDTSPVWSEQTQPTEPVANAPEQTEFPEPVQYNPSNDFNAPHQENPAQPEQTSFGQQFTNNSNSGYSGQQFTNQPQNGAPSGKKPMSGGKIAAIVISIVLGLIIILGIIVGVVACNFGKLVTNITNKTFDELGSAISELEDYTYLDWEENTISTESSDSSDDDDYGLLDSNSHCYYMETDGGVKITGYDNMYEYDSKTLVLEVPSQIDGKDVVEVESLGVYNVSSYDDDEKFIKVVIPGSVKLIREYAMSFNEDIDEVVIEDGVETIEPNAFFGCEELKKVTVPKSVKTMDDCGIGLEYEDEESFDETVIEGFVLYGTKGSTAESYAKLNNIKFAEAK